MRKPKTSLLSTHGLENTWVFVPNLVVSVSSEYEMRYRKVEEIFLVFPGLQLVHLSLSPAVTSTTDNLVRHRYLSEVFLICPETATYQESPIIQCSLSVFTVVASHCDSLSLIG